MANLIAEYFLKDIEEILIKNNTITVGVRNHSEFIYGGNSVNIPQGYANPGTILMNPSISSLPIAATNRTDDNLKYDLRTMATAPQIVSNIEQVQIAYDKRQSLMRTQYTNLVNSAYDWMIYDWAKGANTGSTVMTSGTARPVKNSYQTGVRKAFSIKDLWDANTKLDQQRIPKDGRVLLLPTSFARDLKEWGSEVSGVYNLNSDAIATELGYKGKINMIDNTVIITRSTVATGVYASSGITSLYTPDVYTETSSTGVITGSTCSDVAILFHPDYLSYAIGTPEVYLAEKQPGYYGDVISMLIRLGGSVIRKDGAGVVLIGESL